MSFDWKNYLDLAEKFQKISSGKAGGYVEGIKRTVISRAYYAGFHEAEDYATSSGYVKPTRGHHQLIQTWYRKQFGNVNHQEIQQILARSLKARKEADYDGVINGNLDNQMESIILDIKRIKQLI